MKLRNTTHLVLLTLMVAVSGITLAYADSITVLNTVGSSRLGCEVNDNCFTPYTAEINVGDTVTWINPDAVAHTVVSGDDIADPDFGSLFDSGIIYPNGKFSYQFDEAGTFPYTCKVHPWMEGVVLVTEAMIDDEMISALSGNITIGALHPLSGDLGGLGAQLNLATELAVEDFNEYLQSVGATWSLDMTVIDTNTTPTVAFNGIQLLHSRGIDLVVGPTTSSNTQQVKGYADSNGMLVVSCCSTAPSLAIAGDSIYRMVPDDSNQGAAIAKLLEVREMEALVPMWRADPYGDGLRDAAVNKFAAIGGVSSEGIRYVPESPAFGLEVASLADQVQEMVDEYGADKVGVLLISFEESIQIIQAADGHDILKEVSWFVSEAVVDELDVDDPIVGRFVESTNFSGTTILISEGDKAQSVQDRMSETLGSTPTVFSYPAYDAVWILGKAIEYADSDDPALVKRVMQQVATEYSGAMQNTELNGSGDLSYANYEIKDVVDNTWEGVRKYMAQYDLITAIDQPQGAIEVGSLYPITGSAASTGFATRDATALGAEDFNNYLVSIGEDSWELKLVEEDSETRPDIALQKAQTMFARGIDIIIGPRPSAEVTQIKPYADTNNMLLVSCCSTSPALNIADDSVYRIAVDDVYQGDGVSKLFEVRNIEAVVPIWRADAYGDGLVEIIKARADSRGYTAADGVRYNPDQADFSVSVAELADQVQEQVDAHGADKVVVFIVSFDKAIQIAQSAANYDILDDVWWFGAETFVHKTFNDPITDEMVMRTNFGAMITAEVNNEAKNNLKNYFEELYGDVPTSYIYSAYDIPWLVGLSILHAGAADASSVKSVFSDVASNFVGANGDATLNENGDLPPRDYAIWTQHTGEWELTDEYYSPTDDAIHSTNTMMSIDR